MVGGEGGSLSLLGSSDRDGPSRTLFPTPRNIFVLAQTKTDCPMKEHFCHLFFQHCSAFRKIIVLDPGDFFAPVLNYVAENYAQRQR
jgi:hypothetical protein